MQITESLVKKLIASQFPRWADLPVKLVEPSGHDNRTFRLGEKMLVRLPSAQRYAAQILKEQQWLPFLAQRIPASIALGQPSHDFPFNWSVYSWLDGQSANLLNLDDITLEFLARKLTSFLKELHAIDVTGGSVAGEHNFFRGGDLSIYASQTEQLLEELKLEIDYESAKKLWQKSKESVWRQKPVWVHGDLSAGNILVKDKQLSAVIDFGCLRVGDPACDLVIAWTLFKNDSRKIFQESLSLDCHTWQRAKGWALWKGLLTLQNALHKNDKPAELSQKVLIEQIIKVF